MKQLGIECITANALLELEREFGIREIKISDLFIYANKLVELYKKEIDSDVVLIAASEDIRDLVLEYPDYFELKEQSLKLAKDADLFEIKELFRWSVSYEMLKIINKVDITNVIDCW